MLAPTLASPSHISTPEARTPLHSFAATGTPFQGPFFDEDSEIADWTEEEIVHLHWLMLQQVGHLADPEHPLVEKFDTLQWIFSDPDKDDRPFSFVNCLRVVGCSPLSPIPYCGQVDAEDVRDRIRTKLKPWLDASLERYPAWVRQAVVTRPDWVNAHLSRNPQWINEQLKRIKDQGDLFA